MEFLVEIKTVRVDLDREPETPSQILNDIATILHDLGLCAAFPDGPRGPESDASQARSEAWRRDHPDPEQEDFYCIKQGIWQVCWAPRAETAPEASWVNSRVTEYMGVSVQTPLFWPTSKWMETIDQVCQAIREKRTVGMNTSTALKVDIKLAGKDFKVQSLKTIVKFLWTAGPFIDQLHPPHCASNSCNALGLPFTVGFSPFKNIDLGELSLEKASAPYLFNKGKAFSLTTSLLELHKMTKGHLGPYYSYRLWKLDRVATLEDLVQMMRILPVKNAAADLRGAYQFSNLLADNSDERTLGFSQHSGTMDVEHLSHWVAICLTVVDTCLSSTSEQMTNLLQELSNRTFQDTEGGQDTYSPSYAIDGLLYKLNLEDTASYYKDLGPNPFGPELKGLGLQFAVNLEGIEEDSKHEPQYTFGVEMEFMVPATDKTADPFFPDRRWYIDGKDWEYAPEVEDGSRFRRKNGVQIVDLMIEEDYSKFVREKVAEILTENGLFALTSDHPDERTVHSIANTGGFILRPEFPNKHQAWHIQYDISLGESAKPVDGYNKGYAGIEVASPMGRANRSGFKRFISGLSLLRNSLRTFHTAETGLHVHISSHDGRFKLLQLKRIATIIWFCEPVLQLLIARHRRGPGCSFCLPISTASNAATSTGYGHPVFFSDDTEEEEQLKKEMESHIPLELIPSERVQSSMKAIWNAGDCRTLSELISSGSTRCAVSFSHIKKLATMTDDGEHILQGTIEFRSAHGSMDQMYIIQWVRLCVALVQVGQHGKAEDIHEIVARLAIIEENPLVNLPFVLDKLGLSQDLEFWEGQAHIFSSNMPEPTCRHVPPVSKEEEVDMEEFLKWIR